MTLICHLYMIWLLYFTAKVQEPNILGIPDGQITCKQRKNCIFKIETVSTQLIKLVARNIKVNLSLMGQAVILKSAYSCVSKTLFFGESQFNSKVKKENWL